MPDLFRNILVVTETELMQTGCFKSVASLRGKIQRGNAMWVQSYKKVRRASKGSPALIAYDQLPNKVKGLIKDPRKKPHLLELFHKKDIDAEKYFTNCGLSEKLIQQYTLNAEILEAAIALKEARTNIRRSLGIKMIDLMKTVVSDIHHYNQVLHIKHTLPKSVPRFRDLINEFLKPCEHSFNYACLISGKVGNKNRNKND